MIQDGAVAINKGRIFWIGKTEEVSEKFSLNRDGREMDATGKVVGQSFAEQTEQVLRNLGIALAAGGAQFHHIVKMNVYVRDLTSEKVKTLRAIRQRHFGGHQPASTLIGTTALVHEELMLEIEAIAVID